MLFSFDQRRRAEADQRWRLRVIFDTIHSSVVNNCLMLKKKMLISLYDFSGSSLYLFKDLLIYMDPYVLMNLIY